ncbi:MAG: hypothetical protein KDC90_13430, partial [Ignavibacteriae bacterium]|nr:hypothetical protein [Ignavibacteriota bacterium]
LNPEEGQVLSKDTKDKDAKDKDTSKIGDITIDGFPCDIRIEVSYEFHHYEPKDGKVLGIWPENRYEDDVNKFNQLRTKWGFTKYFHSRDETIFNRAISSAVGFTKSNIWVGINKDNYYSKVAAFGNVCAYYLDEPNYNGVPATTFSYIKNFINQFSSSFFYTGDMKPVYCVDPYADIADAIMCTKYSDGIWMGLCAYIWDTNNDQRPLWSSFKDRYSNKNKFNWISAKKDYPNNEFQNLLGKALNQNMNEVWLFHDDSYNDAELASFCQSAFYKGFLKRYGLKVTKYYRCIEGNCAICSEGGTWTLYNVITDTIPTEY